MSAPSAWSLAAAYATVNSMTDTPLRGTCAFRLMPHEALEDAESNADLGEVAPGQLALLYTWQHPSDGPQRGLLLVGAPEEGAAEITAAWADSWHQKPGLATLTGTSSPDAIELETTYAGDWGWRITLAGTGGDEVIMVMRNVVPESALSQLPPGSPPIEAGPYDVMVARWSGQEGV